MSSRAVTRPFCSRKIDAVPIAAVGRKCVVVQSVAVVAENPFLPPLEVSFAVRSDSTSGEGRITGILQFQHQPDRVVSHGLVPR